MRVICNCGRTLNPEGKCDASHALTEEQYAEMKERRRQIELNKYRRRALDQWFEDGSCTGGEIKDN
jgi:hypothetical protein